MTLLYFPLLIYQFTQLVEYYYWPRGVYPFQHYPLYPLLIRTIFSCLLKQRCSRKTWSITIIQSDKLWEKIIYFISSFSVIDNLAITINKSVQSFEMKSIKLFGTYVGMTVVSLCSSFKHLYLSILNLCHSNLRKDLLGLRVCRWVLDSYP